jgi:hypothetical protein
VTFDFFQLLTVYQNQQEYRPTVTTAQSVSSTFAVSRLETKQMTPSNLKCGHMISEYRDMWYSRRFDIVAPNLLHINKNELAKCSILVAKEQDTFSPVKLSYMP